MDELVERLVANVGVSRTAAEHSIGIFLDFLKTEGPPEKVQALLEKLPGSEVYLQSADAAGDGGMFMSGIMGAGTRMMSAGLSMLMCAKKPAKTPSARSWVQSPVSVSALNSFS